MNLALPISLKELIQQSFSTDEAVWAKKFHGTVVGVSPPQYCPVIHPNFLSIFTPRITPTAVSPDGKGKCVKYPYGTGACIKGQ